MSAVQSNRFRARQAPPSVRPWTFSLLSTLEDGARVVVLVLSVDSEAAYIVPVSGETRFAAEWDVLLDSSVLGYEAIIECWNTGWVLAEQLQEELVEAN